jgi:aerobic carbon-monoxide dehydrogenase large subunit
MTSKEWSGRREDFRFLSGKGCYVSDINLRGQLHLVFVRSPISHGVIKRICSAAASRVPGVVAILGFADLHKVHTIPTAWSPTGIAGSRMASPPWPVLAADIVRYTGEAILAVVAENIHAARSAAALVEVEFDQLPAVAHAEVALSPHAPVVHTNLDSGNLCLDFGLGDVPGTATALRDAPVVVELQLRNSRVAVCPLEPRAVLAEPTIGGGLVLYSATQVPHTIRTLLSTILNIDETSVCVRSPDVGGAFGGKMALYPEDVVASFLALGLGRPVKWTATRSESFLADTQARDHWTRAKLAVDRQGHILSLQVTTIANVGAYLSLASPAIPTWYYAPLLTGAYRVPVASANVKLAFTNTTPVDAYRGAGRPEACFVIERLMDEAANRLGLKPDEIRRRNFFGPADYPAATSLGLSIDCGDYPGLLDRALLHSRWSGFEGRRRQARQRGKYRGIGLSAYLEVAGGSPSHVIAAQGAVSGSFESARVQVIPSGGVVISVGTHSQGQSHETVFPGMVADWFGLDPKQVRFVQGDTDKIPVGRGTFASRSLGLAGAALLVCVDRIKDKMRVVAGEILEAAAEDIEFQQGMLVVRGTDRAVNFHEVSRACYRLPQSLATKMAPGIDETAFVEPPDWTFPGGCHVVEVEVDPETGQVELVSVTAVDDVGNVIDPIVVEGQIHGGLAQGLGQAMQEEVVYDSRNAQPLTGSFMDYAMPRASNFVSFDTHTHGVPTQRNALGVKGCAESGTVGIPAAFINALIDALRPLGVRDVPMPATPFRVWSTIQVASTQAQRGWSSTM